MLRLSQVMRHVGDWSSCCIVRSTYEFERLLCLFMDLRQRASEQDGYGYSTVWQVSDYKEFLCAWSRSTQVGIFLIQ